MEESVKRIVVLGKTGAGKSTLANTMCGQLVCKVDHTATSGTSKCQSNLLSVNGKNILYIDTPGFFDTGRSEEEMKSEIVKCITECAPGPHAFLIVLKVEKYTKHEKSVVEQITKYFSDEAFRFAAIIFTHGDQLHKGMKIEDFVKKSKGLCDLIEKCGGRCHVFDNRYWKNNQEDDYRTNQYQVAELLKTIDKIFEANNGDYFTNEMLQKVNEDIQQEEGRIKQSSPDITEEEATTKGKDIVTKNLLLKVAGVAAGAILCAFLATKLVKEDRGIGIALGVAVGTAAGAAAVPM